MTHKDIHRQIPDYVLGLLSDRQHRVVERHVFHCSACQRIISRERELSRLLRSTIDVATNPDSARVRSLMPAIPKRREPGLVLRGWQKQLAPALLILLLLFGGLIINSMLPAGSVPGFVATAHAATATSTNTPTATMAQAMPEIEQTNSVPFVTNGNVVMEALPKPSADVGHAMETPDPLPTPIAAIRQAVQ